MPTFPRRREFAVSIKRTSAPPLPTRLPPLRALKGFYGNPIIAVCFAKTRQTFSPIHNLCKRRRPQTTWATREREALSSTTEKNAPLAARQALQAQRPDFRRRINNVNIFNKSLRSHSAAAGGDEMRFFFFCPVRYAVQTRVTSLSSFGHRHGNSGARQIYFAPIHLSPSVSMNMISGFFIIRLWRLHAWLCAV